jgi:hypothetical protein
MSSFKVRLIVLTLGGLLAGCVASAPLEAPLSTDLVKDEATAIRLGQEACVNVQYLERAQKEGGWHAELHKGIWRTWQKTGVCESFGTSISAATGQSDGSCTICVS